MGKKSVAYKRRLRRLQQLRKRGSVEGVQADVISSPVALKLQRDRSEGRRDEDTRLSGGEDGRSGGENDSIEGDRSEDDRRDAHDNLELKEELEEVKKKNLKLQERFERHSRYYKNKLEVTEWKLNNAEEQCAMRIKQVRSFWIDKIYKESSRPGKILKMAMQQR
jgi:predicted RNase H-like nuclease (RuvC/YqgF family)